MNFTLPITVVIPVRDGEQTIGDCLASVFRAEPAPSQVIVVDDGSTDRSAQIAAAFPCSIIHTERRGAAAARNAGARAAQNDLLFFLDADIRMSRDTLARIVETLHARPEISAMFGSYQKETIPTNFFSIYKNLLHHYTHQVSAPDAATFCGGYGAVRRSVFRELGGFDETQGALEDIEFGYRMYRAGHRILLDKTLQFTHAKKYTLLGLIQSDVFNRSIPWTQVMLKRRIFRNDLNTQTNNVLSVILVGLIAAMLPLFFVTRASALVLLVAAVGLVLLNLPFYAFVFRERGLFFTLGAVLMNWFNYFYSGIGLLLGLFAYVLERAQRGRTKGVRP